MFSNIKKEYKEQVNTVLKRLESVGLQVDVKKLEFIVQETKFLL